MAVGGVLSKNILHARALCQDAQELGKIRFFFCQKKEKSIVGYNCEVLKRYAIVLHILRTFCS